MLKNAIRDDDASTPFGDCQPTQLEQLAGTSRKLSFDKNIRVVKEGAKKEEVYVVFEGKAKVAEREVQRGSMIGDFNDGNDDWPHSIIAADEGLTVLALSIEDCMLALTPESPSRQGGSSSIRDPMKMLKFSEEALEKALKEALRVASVSRMRVSGGSLCFGWFLITLGIAAGQIPSWAAVPRLPFWMGGASNWYYALIAPGLCSCLLALLPTDACAIHAVTVLTILVFTAVGVGAAGFAALATDLEGWLLAFLILLATSFLVMAALLTTMTIFRCRPGSSCPTPFLTAMKNASKVVPVAPSDEGEQNRSQDAKKAAKVPREGLKRLWWAVRIAYFAYGLLFRVCPASTSLSL